MPLTCTRCGEPWGDNAHVCNTLLVAQLREKVDKNANLQGAEGDKTANLQGEAMTAPDLDVLVASLSKSCKAADSCLECARDRSAAAAALVQLRDRIAALEAEVARIKDEAERALQQYQDRGAAIAAAMERIAALEAERDANAKDAERYRWLRDWPETPRAYMVSAEPWCVRIEIQGCVPMMVPIYTETLDAAIDAARENS